jgi:hypothetical protein
MKVFSLFFLFVCATLFFAFPNSTNAQTNAGITLIPAFVEEGADPGAVFERSLTVTNESEIEKEFYLFKKNIKGVEAGGVPIFAEDEAEITGYEITEWISLQEESLVVPAFGSVELKFTVSVPDSATPGSHFGGIFISAEPPKFRKIGAGVGYEVASILSIRISGDIIDTARIRSFSTDKLLYNSKNVNFDLRIENQGNILIRPHGVAEITSMFSSKPVVMTVNEELAGVFPGTIRDMHFSWNDTSLGFGRYQAILALTYDGDGGKKTIDASTVFWVFPTKIILTALGALIIILVGGYFLTRYYINQAIMRAGGGRRIPPQKYRKQVGVSRFTFVFMSVLTILVLFLLLVLIFFA